MILPSDFTPIHNLAGRLRLAKPVLRTEEIKLRDALLSLAEDVDPIDCSFWWPKCKRSVRLGTRKLINVIELTNELWNDALTTREPEATYSDFDREYKLPALMQSRGPQDKTVTDLWKLSLIPTLEEMLPRFMEQIRIWSTLPTTPYSDWYIHKPVPFEIESFVIGQTKL